MKLSRTSRLLLTALAPEPLHGYGIIKSVERSTLNNTRLAVGTVYGAIDRLERDSLITLDREEVERGRARKFYRITDLGRAQLVQSLTALQRETATGWSNLGLPIPEGLS